MYLLTNVMDHRRLKVKSASRIYRLRWGVELFYRTLKQTLDRAKLRSRSGRRCRLELEWLLIALSIVALMGVEATHRAGDDPRRISPANLVRTIRFSLGSMITPEKLERQLSLSLRDNYQRRSSKASRHSPKTRNTPYPLKLRPPWLRKATRDERKQAENLRSLKRAA